MRRQLKKLLLAFTALAAFATAGQAALSADEVQVRLTAQKVATDAQGKESLMPADRAAPGDIIEYQVVYTNAGNGAVRSLLATLPVPPAAEFIAGTASPRTAQASLDGKTFAPIPLVRTVKLPDGSSEVREVPASEYRYLRWPLNELAVGQSATVNARMRVISR